DVAAHVARAVQPVFGDRFPANPVLERMKDRGWLGQKTGVGFYRYRRNRKRVFGGALLLLQENEDPVRASLLKALPTAVRLREARDRMVLVMVNEAAACLGEGLAASAEMIDLAMVLGTGWAPHRGGPLRYAHDRGLSDVVRTLGELSQRWGRRFEPCAELRRLAGA